MELSDIKPLGELNPQAADYIARLDANYSALSQKLKEAVGAQDELFQRSKTSLESMMSNLPVEVLIEPGKESPKLSYRLNPGFGVDDERQAELVYCRHQAKMAVGYNNALERRKELGWMLDDYRDAILARTEITPLTEEDPSFNGIIVFMVNKYNEVRSSQANAFEEVDVFEQDTYCGMPRTDSSDQELNTRLMDIVGEGVNGYMVTNPTEYANTHSEEVLAYAAKVVGQSLIGLRGAKEPLGEQRVGVKDMVEKAIIEIPRNLGPLGS